MRDQIFEPFGQPIAHSAHGTEDDGEISALLRYAGIGVFWALIFSILTARVLFLDPDFEKAFAGTLLSSIAVFCL